MAPSSSNIHSVPEIVTVSRSREASASMVEIEEVQRIPNWFVKMVTGAIVLATPWAAWLTVTTMANQFATSSVQAEVSSIKADTASVETASQALAAQTVELRADVKYIGQAMTKYESDSEGRADLRASVKRLEAEVSGLRHTVESMGGK